MIKKRVGFFGLRRSCIARVRLPLLPIQPKIVIGCNFWYPEIQRQVKKVTTSLRCHGNCDVNKTQIITNFHLNTKQVWLPFPDIFFNVVNVQTSELSCLKNPVEPSSRESAFTCKNIVNDIAHEPRPEESFKSLPRI